MNLDLVHSAIALWLATLALAFWRERLARIALVVGMVVMLVALAFGFLGPVYHGPLAGQPGVSGSGQWLLFFGLLPALAAVATQAAHRFSRFWLSGVASSLLGALFVVFATNGVSFLIAWEVMSLGGAAMVLADRQANQEATAGGTFFMLALLEVGAIALLVGILLVGARHMSFGGYAAILQRASPAMVMSFGVLFLIGCGAKLGLVPFYEWYPAVYGSATGATGAILSGVMLNVAWFALARALLTWVPVFPGLMALGIVVVAAGTMTAMLAILYAFQQDDWRRLLAFSSAENAGLAVVALGAALLFKAGHEMSLMSLAIIVGLLHLAGHSLAKGSLLLTADRVHAARGHYKIAQSRLLALAPWTLGVGALGGAMSLAAMPPTAGFVSEWYLLETVFQGFHLHNPGARLTLALAGAGLALTAAIALATMVKLFGVGLLGKNDGRRRPLRDRNSIAVLALGAGTVIYAALMPVWLTWLAAAAPHMAAAASQMVDGVILVPLTAGFAFISPTLLIVVGPLLALIPITMLVVSIRGRIRRAPVWAHGLRGIPDGGATTALVFANALREFYSFVYRPHTVTERRVETRSYFVKALHFETSQAPIFTPYVFAPTVRAVRWLGSRVARMQMGSMNAYIGYIGVVLLLILATVFVR
ncbi:MAG: proton-conducting transporter transmembrane domain-containing protein [Acidiferrobacter sp.]